MESLHTNKQYNEKEIKSRKYKKKRFFLLKPLLRMKKSDEESENNEEITLIIRKFKSFIKKKKIRGENLPPKGESNKKDHLICYRCNKQGIKGIN